MTKWIRSCMGRVWPASRFQAGGFEGSVIGRGMLWQVVVNQSEWSPDTILKVLRRPISGLSVCTPCKKVRHLTGTLSTRGRTYQ